jgi:hypothetical protein
MPWILLWGNYGCQVYRRTVGCHSYKLEYEIMGYNCLAAVGYVGSQADVVDDVRWISAHTVSLQQCAIATSILSLSPVCHALTLLDFRETIPRITLCNRD